MTDETSTTGVGGTPPPKAVTTVTAGTLIMGTYEIELLINSGGMGEVYRGRNIHNGEPVAIKIVLPSLAHDTKIVALFQKESTTLSRLAHEAIVRYHVFTNDPTIGRPCMVMEFVSGTSIADRIEQGPMPLDDVKVMLRRVASGLDKAHRAGVVHRDLSPDNVILEEDLVSHAKLIDFGIAKSSNFGTGTLLQGQFAGKFNWVSPEQLGAYGGNVDGRSDIYSLALITAGVSRGKVLQMGASIVDAVSSRSSVPDLEGVDPALVPLLRWMLEPNPANRIDSMATVIAALDNPALIPGKETLAAPVPDPNRTVIEALPMQTFAPVSVQPSSTSAPIASAPLTSAPLAGQTGVPVQGWDVPAARQTSSVPPDGATVIAPYMVQTAPPMTAAVETDSPFGAPSALTAAPQMAAGAMATPVVAKGGKGGLMGVLAVLILAGGGAGAYFSGMFDAKPATPVAPTEQAETSDPAKPAPTVEAEADALAAQKAADEAAKAEADAAAKAAADAAEAEKQAAATAADEAKSAEEKAAATAQAAAAEARAQAGAVAAARSMAEAALQDAESAAADAAAAEPALVQGLADAAAFATSRAKAAADAASAGLEAATSAVEAAKASEASAAGMDDLLAAVSTDAKAASAASSAADAAAAKAADAVKLAAEAEAARLAEEKAKEDAVQADPVARQQVFYDGLSPTPCVHVQLAEAKPEGFLLHGFSVDTTPLEALSTAWAEATELTPDVAVHLINDDQCAVLDFMNRHKSAEGLTLSLNAKGDVITSGTPVEGTILGVGGRQVTLFLVNGKGGATNLKDFVVPNAEGGADFKFRIKLADGLPPEPQLLIAIMADDALAVMMDKVKPGTNTSGLMPFLDSRLEATGVSPLVGLAFFKLEN